MIFVCEVILCFDVNVGILEFDEIIVFDGDFFDDNDDFARLLSLLHLWFLLSIMLLMIFVCEVILCFDVNVWILEFDMK